MNKLFDLKALILFKMTIKEIKYLLYIVFIVSNFDVWGQAKPDSRKNNLDSTSVLAIKREIPNNISYVIKVGDVLKVKLFNKEIIKGMLKTIDRDSNSIILNTDYGNQTIVLDSIVFLRTDFIQTKAIGYFLIGSGSIFFTTFAVLADNASSLLVQYLYFTAASAFIYPIIIGLVILPQHRFNRTMRALEICNVPNTKYPHRKKMKKFINNQLFNRK